MENVNLIELFFNNWQIVFIYVFKYLKDFNTKFGTLNERLLELEIIEKQRAKHYRNATS